MVRSLTEQVALETRTRMLNPKWHESMLQHGYEGVRQIEAHLTNTMGWSATTGQVQPWVYQQLAQTFILDPEMRERLAKLNPTASAKVANRLIGSVLTSITGNPMPKHYKALQPCWRRAGRPPGRHTRRSPRMMETATSPRVLNQTRRAPRRRGQCASAARPEL